MTVLIIAFIGTFGLICSAVLLVFYRDAVWERFSALVDERLEHSKSSLVTMLRPKSPAMEQIIQPFANVLPRSTHDVSALQKRLIRAGFRQDSAVNVSYGAKVLVPLVLVVIVAVTQVYGDAPFLFFTAAIGIGFLAPDMWLRKYTAKRQLKLKMGLPEALDLMVVCSEAGLSLDQAVLRVSQEVRLSQPELADEFSLLMLEQRAGRPRREALDALAERTDIEAIRALVNMLVQADTFGTSIAKTLRVYSDTMRTRRRQQAEERAAKTTVKLVFPLVVFIFPSLFVVLLGPAMIAMSEGFSGVFGP